MLKRILVIAFVTLIYNTSFSQSRKNEVAMSISGFSLLGNSANFGKGMNGLGLQTAIVTYVSHNTAVVLNFTYTTMHGFSIASVPSNYNSYAFVPAIRNNFLSYYTWNIFAEVGFGLGNIKYNAVDRVLATDKHSDLSGGISILKAGLGGNYAFNDSFGIEFYVPIAFIQNISSQKSSHVFSGFAPTFGLTYALN